MWTIQKLVKHQDDPADDVQAEPTSRRNRQPCKNTYTQTGLQKHWTMTQSIAWRWIFMTVHESIELLNFIRIHYSSDKWYG